jgi:hypothetical protein
LAENKFGFYRLKNRRDGAKQRQAATSLEREKLNRNGTREDGAPSEA